MADKANVARDKLKALNAQLLQKRQDPASKGTATGILSALRESQALDTTNASVEGGGGAASEGKDSGGIETKTRTLIREESTLSMLRRSSVGELQTNPTVPTFHVSPPTSPTGGGASLLDVIQAGSTIHQAKEKNPTSSPNTIFLSTSKFP